jgi:NitT/TauT family transport system substrate-binding protein
MSKIKSLLVIFMTMTFIVMAFSGSVLAKEKITFVVEAGNAIKATAYKMTKIMAAKGYEVDNLQTAGGNQAVQFILGGSADVAVNDTDEVLLAVAQGADIKVFMANATKVDYTLVTNDPNIKTAKDLSGKLVGMSGPAGFDALMGRVFMQLNGVDPDSAKWTIVGGSPDRMKALQVGRIDAAIIFLPHYLQLKAKKAKAYKVVNLADVVPDVLKGVYYARTKWIDKNPKIVKDIIRSQLEAAKWFAEDKAGWKKLALEWAPGSEDIALEMLYTELKDVDMFPLKGGLNEKTANKMVEMMVQVGDLKKPIPLSDWMTFKYYDEVMKEMGY